MRRISADSIESVLLSAMRAKLLRALDRDGGLSGPVKTRHARASLTIERLDARLDDMRRSPSATHSGSSQ